MSQCGFEIARTRDELTEIIRTEKGVIWESDQELYQVLDDLRDVSNNAKLRAKVCKNISFSGQLKCRGNRYTDISSMAELLCELRDDDEVVFLNNNIKEALDFIQQCINVDRHPNVYLEEDFYKKKVLENIENNYQKLSENSQNLLDFISKLEVKSQYKEIFDELSSIVENITKALKVFEKKVISVAVFASKKSGKSMVVNALLGEEYAPTSAELPTPNVVKYVPVEGLEKIIFEYGGNTYEFRSPKEVREEIYRRYKEVEIHGKKLEDMTIKYPLKPGINFLIYDTPGPDLAKSEHDMTEMILPEVDVAIFIVDYSKYSTTSEVELLEKVKDYFEKSAKKHSFICLVNKIDLMFFDTSTEKIKVRVTDFIYNKLNALGFNELIVIPISAITYYYLRKLRDIFGDELVHADNIWSYLNRKRFEADYDDETMTMISTVQNVANSMMGIYRKENITYQDVLEFSNFENFKKYLLNVADRKAKLERTWLSIIRIEENVNKFVTVIKNNELLLSSQAEKIKEELANFLKEYEKSKLPKIMYKLEKELDKVGKEIIKLVKKTLHVNVKQELPKEVEEGVERKLYELEEALESDARRLSTKVISRDDFVSRWSDVKINLQEIIKKCVANYDAKLKKEFKMIVEEKVEARKEEINKSLQDIQKMVEGMVEDLNNRLNKVINEDLTIYKEYFTPPAIILEFNVESFKESLIESIQNLSKEIGKIQVYTSSWVFDVSIKGGFFRWLFSFFGGDRYEVNTNMLRREIIGSLEDDIRAKYVNFESSLEDVLKEQEEQLEEIVESMIEQEKQKVEEYMESVIETVSTIRGTLEKKKEERIEIHEKLTEIKQNSNYSDLTNMWYETYKPYKEYYEQFKKAQEEVLTNE